MTTSMTANSPLGHGVLAEGGYTGIPRWTRMPVPGTAERETVLPDELRPRCAGWPTGSGCH